MTQYDYHVFGLNIRSTIPLGKLPLGDGEHWDVEITEAELPSEIVDAADSGLRYQTKRGVMLMVVDQVGRFMAVNGNKILFQRLGPTDDSAIRLFLLGAVFLALMQQREDLVFQGSAIEADGVGILLLGPSGIGKSTFSAGLALRGRGLLSDELCVVRPGPTSQRMVQPGYPWSNLWPDSLSKFGQLPRELERARQAITKRILPMDDRFCGEPLPLKKIYLFTSAPVKEPTIRKLERAEAQRIGARGLAGPFAKGLGAVAIHRQAVMGLANAIPVIEVTRPRLESNLTELLDKLETDLFA